jgi:hypothetical protein
LLIFWRQVLSPSYAKNYRRDESAMVIPAGWRQSSSNHVWWIHFPLPYFYLRMEITSLWNVVTYRILCSF